MGQDKEGFFAVGQWRLTVSLGPPHDCAYVLCQQVALSLEASASGGTCTAAATAAVKSSVTAFMGSQSGAASVSVSVTCFNANGSDGGSARRLQVCHPCEAFMQIVSTAGIVFAFLLNVPMCTQCYCFVYPNDMCCLQASGSTVWYAVVVTYFGGEAAAQALVTAAQSDVNQIGSLISNVATATSNQVTVQQVRERVVQYGEVPM